MENHTRKLTACSAGGTTSLYLTRTQWRISGKCRGLHFRFGRGEADVNANSNRTGRGEARHWVRKCKNLKGEVSYQTGTSEHNLHVSQSE